MYHRCTYLHYTCTGDSACYIHVHVYPLIVCQDEFLFFSHSCRLTYVTNIFIYFVFNFSAILKCRNVKCCAIKHPMVLLHVQLTITSVFLGSIAVCRESKIFERYCSWKSSRKLYGTSYLGYTVHVHVTIDYKV